MQERVQINRDKIRLVMYTVQRLAIGIQAVNKYYAPTYTHAALKQHVH